MSINEAAIAWLETQNEILKNSLRKLDKDYISEKKEIEFNIKENKKLIKILESQ